MQLHLPTLHVCVVTTIFGYTLTVHGTLLHLYHIEFSLVHTLGIASQDTNTYLSPDDYVFVGGWKWTPSTAEMSLPPPDIYIGEKIKGKYHCTDTTM